MIFIGDIAHPFTTPPTWTKNVWPWASTQMLVANLEGALAAEVRDHLRHRRLFNHSSVLDTMVSANIRAVTLANNHIMDIPGALSETLATLRARGIKFTGAGLNLHDAGTPCILIDEDKTYLLLGFGWETIQCESADQHKAGVSPLRPLSLLGSVKYWRTACSGAVLVLLLHWNYEMELYPQPADRQLAMTAIDAGADAVIGHHPHRVGGVEMYQGRPIVYSLGNWWMPQRVYCNGKLTFGDESLIQLALEWRQGDMPVCHWFEYQRENHELRYIESDRLSESPRIKELTPFAGMTHTNYQKWFKMHRVKRKALPIYHDYRHRIANAIKDRYIHMRHSALMAIDRTHLRNLLNI